MDAHQVDALRAAVSRLARRLRNEASSTRPLSATGIAVLGRLRREGPTTLQSLAAAEHVRPPTMTRIIERLAELGMVTKQPNPDDRRSTIVHLHPNGDEYLAATVRQRSQWLTGRIETLTDEEREALSRAIPALQKLGNT
jgi:DNA-binding MarR family transcriptional regulator